MIKKTITYVDYNDIERTEDYYFNLTEAEITEMELGTTGGYAEMIQKIINAKDAPSIIATFKELLLKSYGVKSADGKRFEKSQKLRDEFEQTEAYSKLFMELAFDDKAGAAFINGVIPAGMAKRAEEAKKVEAAKAHPAVKK